MSEPCFHYDHPVKVIGRNSTHVHVLCTNCDDVHVYRRPKEQGGVFPGPHWFTKWVER